MKNCLLILAALFLFSRCGDSHKKETFTSHYTRQPLKGFQDSLSEMPSGTAVNILGYSGGDVAKKGDELYYSQFIVIDRATGDTVRVLAAAVNFEGGGPGGGPVLSPATIYDADKGVRDATYRIPTENEMMMIHMLPDMAGEPDEKKLAADVGEGGANAKEYVLIPDGAPFFARHYKTVMGILSFKERPW